MLWILEYMSLPHQYFPEVSRQNMAEISKIISELPIVSMGFPPATRADFFMRWKTTCLMPDFSSFVKIRGRLSCVGRRVEKPVLDFHAHNSLAFVDGYVVFFFFFLATKLFVLNRVLCIKRYELTCTYCLLIDFESWGGGTHPKTLDN